MLRLPPSQRRNEKRRSPLIFNRRHLRRCARCKILFKAWPNQWLSSSPCSGSRSRKNRFCYAVGPLRVNCNAIWTVQRARYISASNNVSFLRTHRHRLFDLFRRYNYIRTNIVRTNSLTEKTFLHDYNKKIWKLNSVYASSNFVSVKFFGHIVIADEIGVDNEKICTI